MGQNSVISGANSANCVNNSHDANIVLLAVAELTPCTQSGAEIDTTSLKVNKL